MYATAKLTHQQQPPSTEPLRLSECYPATSQAAIPSQTKSSTALCQLSVSTRCCRAPCGFLAHASRTRNRKNMPRDVLLQSATIDATPAHYPFQMSIPRSHSFEFTNKFIHGNQATLFIGIARHGAQQVTSPALNVRDSVQTRTVAPSP